MFDCEISETMLQALLDFRAKCTCLNPTWTCGDDSWETYDNVSYIIDKYNTNLGLHIEVKDMRVISMHINLVKDFEAAERTAYQKWVDDLTHYFRYWNRKTDKIKFYSIRGLIWRKRLYKHLCSVQNVIKFEWYTFVSIHYTNNIK